jgi:hypothetical protein
MKTKLGLLTAGAVALMLGAGTANANAGTLENLERERAIAISTMLDANLTASERQARLEGARRRLIDLERIVLRDKSLRGRNMPNVRRAFENYDLTFLVHAAAEKNLALTDHWLEQVSLTTQAVMTARLGRR